MGVIKVYGKSITQPKKGQKGLVEIEYLVNKSYRGLGIAPAMLTSIEEALFIDSILDNEMKIICGENVNSILLAITKENSASKRVAEKCDFTLESTKYDFCATRTKDDYLMSRARESTTFAK